MTDRMRNEYIRGSAQVEQFGDKVAETRMRWFGMRGEMVDMLDKGC